MSWNEYWFFNEAQEQETNFTIHRLGHWDSTTESLIMPPGLKYIILMTEEESLGYQILIFQSEDPGPLFHVLLSYLQFLVEARWQ